MSAIDDPLNILLRVPAEQMETSLATEKILSTPPSWAGRVPRMPGARIALSTFNVATEAGLAHAIATADSNSDASNTSTSRPRSR